EAMPETVRLAPPAIEAALVTLSVLPAPTVRFAPNGPLALTSNPLLPVMFNHPPVQLNRLMLPEVDSVVQEIMPVLVRLIALPLVFQTRSSPLETTPPVLTESTPIPPDTVDLPPT